MTKDKHVIFGTRSPSGVFRFQPDNGTSFGTPVLPEEATVAADPTSNRWVACQRGSLRIFEETRQVLTIPYPVGKSPYRGGVVVFGPDGSLVVALRSTRGLELSQVDMKEKAFRTLFAWRGERLVNFAVGPRMTWEATQVTKKNNKGDKLTLLSTDPPLPAVLKPGERLKVRFSYTLASGDACSIWVRPYTDGRRSPGYGAHGSPRHPKGTGEREGWFSFRKPTRIDQIHIRMVDVEDRTKPVVELFAKADARWEGAVTQAKPTRVTQTSPSSSRTARTGPAHLQIGKVAPDIVGEDIDDVKFKLSDYRGKVVVLDFWGDW